MPQQAESVRGLFPDTPLPPEAMPVNEYFNKFILPFLAPALERVAQDRPADPVEALANLLLQCSPEYLKAKQDEQREMTRVEPPVSPTKQYPTKQ